MVFGFIKSKFDRLKEALKKTRNFLGDQLRSLFSSPISEETLEQVEELLYEADLGVETAQEIVLSLKKEAAKEERTSAESLIAHIQLKLIESIRLISSPQVQATSPHVILIVGVNGNGKTSSVAKLAKLHQDQGKKVVVAAADTFRAAATEQLEIWADRLGFDLVKGKPNGDPAAVVFDAATAAKTRGADVLLVDTAGRLHTKTNLMKELEKIKRSCGKVIEKAPHETLLVLDATTGQNGIDQAKTFHTFTPITGMILTKLDGTAKGGIAIAIQKALQIPITHIGTGETAEDLTTFEAESYVKALFE